MVLSTNGFWRELKDGIRGHRKSYTSGSTGRAVVLLAVPMVAEMVMQSVFAVVDVYFIGRLGPSSVAAAGMTDSMLTLVFSIAMGLSMAAGVIAVASSSLSIVAYSYPAFAFGMVMVAAFNGGGYQDPDLDQLLLLLGGADSIGVDVVDFMGVGADGGLRHHRDRPGDDRRRRGHDVPEGSWKLRAV